MQNKFTYVVLGISLGVLIGQVTTFKALNPELIRNEAYKLAGLSYKYGCLAAQGKVCAVLAFTFEERLRQQLPIDEEYN